MANRGKLTPEIQAIAKKFLGREITVTELRLYPYLDYVLKNNHTLGENKINDDDRRVLGKLWQEKHISAGLENFTVTKEFYDYIQQVLWLGYAKLEA